MILRGKWFLLYVSWSYVNNLCYDWFEIGILHLVNGWKCFRTYNGPPYQETVYFYFLNHFEILLLYCNKSLLNMTWIYSWWMFNLESFKIQILSIIDIAILESEENSDEWLSRGFDHLKCCSSRISSSAWIKLCVEQYRVN